tara:strand:+ start:173943 stop:175316 length:1374 start_codon:yes stop_codon:yes gene_type:complete
MIRKIWRILLTYIFTWFLAFSIILPRLLRGVFSWAKLYERLENLFSFPGFWIVLHITFILCYLLLLAFLHFKKVYKARGYLVMLQHIGLKFLAPILLLVLIYQGIIYANTYEDFDFNWDNSIENNTNRSHNYFTLDHKQRGMSVFGLDSHDEIAINELVKNNIEWVAVVPFMFQKSQLTKAMNIPDSIGMWTPRDSSFMNTIAALHTKKIHVMLKPHLWMHEGWRSNITLDTPEEWGIWFASYRKNMLHYAAMAEKSNVELLCVGTELKSSLKYAPEQWITLVKDIKTVYSGKLTYAANWDGEFNLVPFWDQMDYIGIQGYFPLTKISSPELDDIKKGWDRHIITLENLANTYQKPILFTEVGYRSDVTTTIRPWEWNEFGSIFTDKKSNKTQQLAYEALFQKLWDKPWFAGTYIWQWDTRSEPNSTHESLDFTPRFKPALNTLAKWYGKPVKKNEN